MVTKHFSDGDITAVYIDKKTQAVILFKALKEKFNVTIKILRIFVAVATRNLRRVFNTVISVNEYNETVSYHSCDIVDFKTGRIITTI